MSAPDEKDPREQGPEGPGDDAAEGAQEPPVQEQLTPSEKLEQPAEAGKLRADAAASIEKTAESAAPAPEKAQPQDAATKAQTPAQPTPKAAAERPARPAREAEAKGPARNAPPPGSINEIIAAALPEVEINAYMVPSVPGEAVAIEVKREDLPAVMALARDDERLDLKYLRCLSGVDWQDDGLEVVYHLWSFNKAHHLTVKTRVTVEDPVVPSVTSLYPAADWHEREARDMFGIVFDGHPNLVPLLLPEDMTDHFPLRKDNPLQEIEEWQGENLREGAGEDEGEE